MDVGGLMAQAFKIFLGNPDIMVTQITWIVFSTLILSVLEINRETKL